MPRLIHLDKMPSRKTRRSPEELAHWDPGASGLRIVELLREYRYLTPTLLALVYASERGRGASQVRHHLRKLYDHEFVERYYRPAEPRTGSYEMVYTLALKGAHLIVPTEEWASERRRIYNLARPRGDYEHLLAVSLLRVLWQLGAPEHDQLFRTAAYWVDKEGDREHVRNSFTVRVGGGRATVRPDTTAVILRRLPTGKLHYRPVFFEIERTHKNLVRTRERLLAYRALLTSQHEVVARVVEKEVGYVPLNGQLVFITAHYEHALSLWRTARGVFGLEGRSTKVVPDVWFLPLTSLFEKDADGRERIIPPAALFERPILFNLESRRDRDEPARWGRLIA